MSSFKCPHCGKEFDSESSMNQHSSDAHSTTHHKPRGIKISKSVLYGIGGIVFVAIIVAYFAFAPQSGESYSTNFGPLGSTHIHADIGVFLDGEQITPLSVKYFVRAREVHVESGAGAGSVIHMHATGVPLGHFFKTIGMSFDSQCFKLDNGSEYCGNEEKTLRMFVQHYGGEWEESTEFGRYIFRDLDRILVTYGSETPEQIAEQQNSVTSFSPLNSDRQMDLSSIPA